MNDIALITGGDKGIGREIARQLAGYGMTGYLGARSAASPPAGDVRAARLDVLVQLATIPADGPTGVFRGPDSANEVIPW